MTPSLHGTGSTHAHAMLTHAHAMLAHARSPRLLSAHAEGSDKRGNRTRTPEGAVHS